MVKRSHFGSVSVPPCLRGSAGAAAFPPRREDPPLRHAHPTGRRPAATYRDVAIIAASARSCSWYEPADWSVRARPHSSQAENYNRAPPFYDSPFPVRGLCASLILVRRCRELVTPPDGPAPGASLPSPGPAFSPIPSSSLVFSPAPALRPHSTPPPARARGPAPTFFSCARPRLLPSPCLSSTHPFPYPPAGGGAPAASRSFEARCKLKSLACLHSKRVEVWSLVFTSPKCRSRNKHIHPKLSSGSWDRHHLEGRVFRLILQSLPFLNMG